MYSNLKVNFINSDQYKLYTIIKKSTSLALSMKAMSKTTGLYSYILVAIRTLYESTPSTYNSCDTRNHVTLE